MSITKGVPLKSNFSMNKNLERFGFESQNFAIFDNFYSTDRKT